MGPSDFLLDPGAGQCIWGVKKDQDVASREIVVEVWLECHASFNTERVEKHVIRALHEAVEELLRNGPRFGTPIADESDSLASK